MGKARSSEPWGEGREGLLAFTPPPRSCQRDLATFGGPEVPRGADSLPCGRGAPPPPRRLPGTGAGRALHPRGPRDQGRWPPELPPREPGRSPPLSARNRPAAGRAERPREPAQPRILHSPRGSGTCSPRSASAQSSSGRDHQPAPRALPAVGWARRSARGSRRQAARLSPGPHRPRFQRPPRPSRGGRQPASPRGGNRLCPKERQAAEAPPRPRGSRSRRPRSRGGGAERGPARGARGPGWAAGGPSCAPARFRPAWPSASS